MARFALHTSLAASLLIIGCGGGGGSESGSGVPLPQADDSNPLEVVVESSPPSVDPQPNPIEEPEPVSMTAPSDFGSRVVAGDPNCIAATDLVITMVGAPDSQTIQFPTETPNGLTRALFFYPDDSTTIIFEQRPASNDCNVFAELYQPEPEPTPQPEAVGLDLVEGIEVSLESESGSVFGRVVEFSVSSRGRPAIRLRIDNNSRETIRNLNCDAAGLLGNRVIGSASLFFAALGPISPGESAADTGEWLSVDNGFAAFDQIRWSCEWINGEQSSSADVSSGPINVSFVEYTSEFGRPAITLLVTNNSGVTIYNVGCVVEAKRDGVIVDGARLFFADLGDIRPGEAAEDTGSWSDLSSLDDFDSNPFDPANLNCSYLVRR